MAARRLSMRKIKEVLRLKWEYNSSNNQIAKSCNIARSTVREYLRRAEVVRLIWHRIQKKTHLIYINILVSGRICRVS